MNALARSSIWSWRCFFFIIGLCLVVAVSYWSNRRQSSPDYFVFGRKFHYEEQAVSFPSTGRSQTWALVEFTFTNPTPESIWYVQRPGMQLNSTTLSQPEPAMVIMHRKTFREQWHEKFSAFPNNLKPPWGLWRQPPPFGNLTNEPVHELRPGQTRNLGIGARPRQPIRVGIICRTAAQSNTPAVWRTNWSAEFIPPPP